MFRFTPDTFEVEPPSVWGKSAIAWPKPPEAPKPSWANDENQKKLFGIELAKHSTAFEAACAMFEDTSHALWASHNWKSDPIVIASRDIYNETANLNLLDKNGLASKLLKFADEKAPNGFPTVDAKDRLAAFRLYAELQGFIGKNEIIPGNNTFNDNRVMKILLVKPENQKTIEHQTEEIQDEIQPIKGIKLVSAR